MADGYRIGYKHGVWRGALYGFAAACALAFGVLVVREAAADERDDIRGLMQWASDYTGLPMPDTVPEVRLVPPSFFQETICQATEHCEAQGWSPSPEIAERFGGEANVIYLDHTLDIETNPYAAALLVHELVHYLQRSSGAFGTVVSRECVTFIQRESQAVLTQRAWLWNHGIADFDASQYMRMYRCEE